MMGSYFNTQMQATFMQFMLKWMDKLLEDGNATSSSTAKETKSSSTASDLLNQAGSFKEIITKAAEKYGVDPDLVASVIKAESNFDPDATSYCGAQGLMQLMPGTARGLGVDDSYDPEQNVNGGTRLLSNLLESYDDNVSLALAAYNAGPGAVAEYGGIPPYQETQTYVNRVLSFYREAEGS